MSNSDDWSGEVEAPKEDESKLNSKQVDKLFRHNEALRDNLDSVVCIKDCIAQGDMTEAQEAWAELSEDEQTALWVAPSFGGIFSTQERKIILNGFKERE